MTVFPKTLLARIARPATGLVLALSLALPISVSPAAVAPAKAGDAELIAGAIGTVVLGAIALNAYTNAGNGHTMTRQAPQVTRQQAHQPYQQQWNGRGDHGRDHGRGHASRTLPQACAISVGRGQNQGVYFGKRCLSQNFSGARALPGYCETQMVDRQSGRVRNVYNGTCLQRAGSRVSGRH